MPRYKDNKDNVKNQQRAYNFFIQKGLSPHASAGIVGNLMQESMLNPTISGDNNTSYGIAQHHKERKTALMKAYPDTYNTLDGQLNFIWDELNSTHKSALNKLNNSTDIKSATLAFQNDFERPHPKYANTDNRIRYAQSILGNYSQQESSNTPQTALNTQPVGVISLSDYTPTPATEEPKQEEQRDETDVVKNKLQDKVNQYNLAQEILSQTPEIPKYTTNNTPRQRVQLIDPYEQILGVRTLS